MGSAAAHRRIWRRMVVVKRRIQPLTVGWPRFLVAVGAADRGPDAIHYRQQLQQEWLLLSESTNTTWRYRGVRTDEVVDRGAQRRPSMISLGTGLPAFRYGGPWR